MIYAASTIVASALAFQAPAHPGGVALARPVIATLPALEMSANGRRVQLATLVGGLSSLAATSAVSAAEPRSTPWSFSTFLDAIEGDLIEKVSFSADGKQILCIDKDGNRHEALILPGQSAELIKLLSKKDIVFNVQEKASQGGNELLRVLPTLAFPLLIIGGLFFLQQRNQQGGGGGGGPMGGMGGPMGIGKARSKIQMEPQTGVTFDDVAGSEASKQELVEIVNFLKNPAKYSALGAKIPRGAVMEGPPGTGKTLLARAVAGEAGVPFVSASGSEFVEMFVGVGASRVRDLFGEAKKNAPCIVFIDEIDAVGRQRAGSGGGMGGGNDEREQTLNQILTEMDGFEGNSGVIVLAATNRADVLDAALLRPGRFDRRVPVDLPDLQGREEILGVHCRGKPLAEALDLGIVAKRTTGFSGASLANLMNEAAIVAARNGKTEISYEEVDYAIDRIQVGMVKKTGTSFPNRQKLVAYHEAGHAVMGLLTPGYDMVTKVTILPRSNGAGGFTLFTPPEERLESGMYSKRYLQGNLAVALGGRVVEELVFGPEEVTTGASGDLQQVRNIARRMVTQWGFSKDKLGAVAWEGANGADPFRAPGASEVREKLIDEEVKLLAAEAYEHCKAVISANRELVDEMVEDLIEKETLDYKELQALLEKYYPDGIGTEKIPLPAKAAVM